MQALVVDTKSVTPPLTAPDRETLNVLCVELGNLATDLADLASQLSSTNLKTGAWISDCPEPELVVRVNAVKALRARDAILPILSLLTDDNP